MCIVNTPFLPDAPVQAVEEAETIIRKVLGELSDPDLGGATCTPAFLLSRTKSTLDVIDSVTDSFSVYNHDPSSEWSSLSLSHSFSFLHSLALLSLSHSLPLSLSLQPWGRLCLLSPPMLTRCRRSCYWAWPRLTSPQLRMGRVSSVASPKSVSRTENSRLAVDLDILDPDILDLEFSGSFSDLVSTS